MLPADNQTTNSPLLILELGTTAITLAASFAWPSMGARFFARAERLLAGFAHRRNLAVFSAGAAVLLLRLAMLPIYGIPLPFVPDDFSFLLAADTFAHGRLTNLTPALWTHFESIHITMVPSYQSMYFPGQGLLLAAGQVLLGHPWFALLIADALMCAALVWMLQAWLPASWALLGGFIAVIRLGLFSDWINTYHTGGSLAALGGALVLGSLPRLMKTVRFRYGLAMGIGIAILVLTRPYEGMLLCLPVGVVLARWALKGQNRPPALVLMRRAALPLAVIVGAIGWLGYYDLKAFGKPTTLPYTVDRSQYAIAPYYIWQQLRPEPHYRHAALEMFYRSEIGSYNQIHSVAGFVPGTLKKAAFTILFYAGFALLLPMLMVRRVVLDKRVRLPVVCLAVLAAGLVIEVYLLPHYVAPFTAVFYAIGLQAMRHLRVWMPEGKRAGLAMVRLTVCAIVFLAGVRVFAQPLGMIAGPWPPSNWNLEWFGPEHFGAARAQIEHQLDELPGGQLVMVRYGPHHSYLDEWVYNQADIGDAKVIWARDMNAAENEELVKYYGNRTIWLVEPDANPARLTPYPAMEP